MSRRSRSIPSYARAYALLANLLRSNGTAIAQAPDPRCWTRAFDLARKAVALDENDSVCHGALGLVHLAARCITTSPSTTTQKALVAQPQQRHAARQHRLSLHLSRQARGRRSTSSARPGIIDPFFKPSWYWSAVGAAHFMARQYDEAIAALSRATMMPYWAHAYLAAAHALARPAGRARHHAAEVLRLAPNFSIARSLTREPLKREATGASGGGAAASGVARSEGSLLPAPSAHEGSYCPHSGRPAFSRPWRRFSASADFCSAASPRAN